MVKYWIQHADFKTEDLGEISRDEAIRTFQNHDWTAENARFIEIEKSEKENCPPGIGFKADGVGILHICPNQNEKALCFFHKRTRIKILGFLPWQMNRNYELSDVPISSIPDFIAAFYGDNIDTFIKLYPNTPIQPTSYSHG
jgi:hypothetical protein